MANELPRPKPKLILAVVGLAVSVLFTYVAVKDVEWSAFWLELGRIDYVWVLPSLAALALAFMLKALRWRMFFSLETRPPLRPVTSALLIGHLFNNILPVRAGEAARIVALNQRTRTSLAEATGTVIAERLYDTLALLALFFCVYPFLPEVAWLGTAALFAGVLLAVSLGATILLARYGDRPLQVVLRPLGRVPGIPATRIEGAATSLVRGLAALHRPRIAVSTFLLTIASSLALALSFWLMLLGFDVDAGFSAGLLIVITTNLAMILPSSPAAVGVFEAATIAALHPYGVADSQALSYAIVVHVQHFLPFVVVGYVVLHWHILALRKARLRPGPAPVPSKTEVAG